jgi:uncharacterized protein (TIGR02231 family)
MKKYSPIILLFFLSSILYAGSQKSEIKEVVVYRNGARITRLATFTVTAGNQEVVISNLTSTLDANSLQVSVRGNATLLSASVRTNFMGYETLPHRTREIQDSLQLIKDKIDWINHEQAINEGEEKLINENQRLVNEKTVVTAAEIAQLADLYRNRLNTIRKRTYDNNLQLRSLTTIKLRLDKQLADLQHQRGKRMGEVVLNLSATQPATLKVELSYLTYNAGWNPIYDLRCASTEKPIDLVYKANIHQTTGFDWEGIDLVVSTGNPAANNERPVLNPWFINFDELVVVGYGTRSKSEAKMAAPAMSNMYIMADEESLAEEDMSMQAPVPYQVNEVTNQMATEYQIAVKQSIPSDGKEHIVPISQFELPAAYTYHTVPKLDPHAFLLAKAGNYNQYNLLPGNTNIFFEGMYIGQTFLNPDVTADSLVVSMGRDDRISVQRNMLKDLDSRRVIGTHQKVTKGYELIIRNNKRQPVKIELLDQVPISNNKEIEVEIEESGDAKYTADYGKLLWELELAPGETRKIRFVYSVKYPKDKIVTGL